MSGGPRFRAPPWRGEEPLAGKTILLHAEQGLGDTVQFVRYAPLLARMGARVVLEVQPELKVFLSGLDGVAAVFAEGEKLPRFDLHCPLASLPFAMKTEPATIPSELPYLNVSEQQKARWQARLANLARPRIALAWSGRSTHANDRNRSMTLAELEPLIVRTDLRFISVQREVRSTDTARLAADRRIAHIGDELADFADTAAVLSAVDFLICVDTSVAHVAGALGRPAFVLLPFQPDWRWGLDREASPWYPSLRLLRQERPGDWAGVIERASAALSAALR
jgi:hypothetical protein